VRVWGTVGIATGTIVESLIPNVVAGAGLARQARLVDMVVPLLPLLGGELL
jgi:hypothetical protein